MAASLLIHIFPLKKQQRFDLQFFEAEDWTLETENSLYFKLQELLTLMRPLTGSCSLEIDFVVEDFDAAIHLLKKNIKGQPKIRDKKLTIRELEVLSLIIQGFTNNEIASKLFICYETVKSHIKNIFLKTGMKNTAALINYYHNTFFEKWQISPFRGIDW